MRENKQRYWEDVKVGEEIPGFSLKIDATRMVLQVSGSQDFNLVHHDSEYAKSAKLPDLIMNTGFMQASFNRLLWDWMGDDGWIRKFKMEMRRPNIPGDTMTVKGKVSGKYIKDGEHIVECEVWAENQREGLTTPTQATLVIPSKGKQ